MFCFVLFCFFVFDVQNSLRIGFLVFVSTKGEPPQLKSFPCELLKELTLVDSPGMIDSRGEGRGYDFMEVVKWFVERADIVVFMFDPDKPGTTGETLQVFTEVLGGVDHKLILVLNKIDTLLTVQDFSRCYGTLCWNLSKTISFKDMPYIHATYIKAQHDEGRKFDLSEFDAVRDNLVKKIKSAPKRRADNIITELKNCSEFLTVHSRVISELRNEMWWFRFRAFALFFLGLIMGCVLVYSVSEDLKTRLLLSVVPMLMMLIMVFWYPSRKKALEEFLTDKPNLRATFEKIYVNELLSDEKDYYERIWLSISASVESIVHKFSLLSFNQITSGQLKTLEEVRDSVQDMLSQVHHSLSKNK